MVNLPPTPYLPDKMGGWGVEDQSLLMDQGPIFGDESMLEMTFEMSRTENGQGDGRHWPMAEEEDESTDTIMMAATDGKRVTTAVEQGEWEVEVAREAGGHLDHQEPTFFTNEEINRATDHPLDHSDYYGDYPPSPFLDRSMRKPERAVDVAQSITLPEDDVLSPLSPNIDISFNQADLESPGSASLSLEAIIPEETSITARGEKSTWAEEESTRSREVSVVVEESGHVGIAEGCGSRIEGAGTKRPASSPRQAQEKKKPKQRSPSQDDYYSRRLSRSVSTTSMTFASPLLDHVDLPVSKHLGRSPSVSLNAVAGPSSRTLVPNFPRDLVASPPIHASIPALSVLNGDEDQDVPPPRPSFLSRLIARSSILHPASTISKTDNSPSETTSGHSSIRDPPSEDCASPRQSKTSDIPSVDHDLDDSKDVETARSRRVSGTPSVHPVWETRDGEPEDRSIQYFDTSLLRRSTSRGSMEYDLGSMVLSIGNRSSASEISINPSRHSASSLPVKTHLDLSTSSSRSHHPARLPSNTDLNQSVSPDISHSTKSSSRLQRPLSTEPGDYQTSFSSTGSESIQPSTTNKNDNQTSLRRSTSQRVIGFFSDLLRTSTSSRSGSDQIQTPTSNLSASVSRAEEMDENELSVGDIEEHIDFEEQGHELDSRSSRRDLGESRSQYSADPHRGTYIPPLPRYIPLTRPNKAPISHTAARAANPVRRPRPIPSTARPAGTSSFASAALARLPPPGKGCSSAGEKIVVKPVERATNLLARRALFEKSKNQPVFPVVPGKENVQTRINPDKGISARLEEKRRMREVEERKKKIEEERAYRDKRKETVVKARPVPDMYRRKLH